MVERIIHGRETYLARNKDGQEADVGKLAESEFQRDHLRSLNLRSPIATYKFHDVL